MLNVRERSGSKFPQLLEELLSNLFPVLKVHVSHDVYDGLRDAICLSLRLRHKATSKPIIILERSGSKFSQLLNGACFTRCV